MFAAASFCMGWAAFMCISPNVKEEGAMKEDTGTQDTPYTEVGAGVARFFSPRRSSRVS